MKHPFKPIIPEISNKLLIGTLPPENASFYFSNNQNTRLWDLLRSIANNENIILKNTNSFANNRKIEILEKLSLGISDIILEYNRNIMSSTKDSDIIPIKYNNILSLISETNINTLLFLYKSAANWFMDSLINIHPKPLSRINNNINNSYGEFHNIDISNRNISCILLPSPLNRGKNGETLKFKLELYRKYINSNNQTTSPNKA